MCVVVNSREKTKEKNTHPVGHGIQESSKVKNYSWSKFIYYNKFEQVSRDAHQKSLPGGTRARGEGAKERL